MDGCDVCGNEVGECTRKCEVCAVSICVDDDELKSWSWIKDTGGYLWFCAQHGKE